MKNVVRKDATITSTGSDDDFPGTFEVILSAPTLDRDGDTLMPEDWKTPLPEHITFDIDHGMSVASTVGSGVPEIDEATGNLIVRGSFSSLPRAQEVRTLVKEGHINRTSVAFMNERQKLKDGKTRNVRELLNGAFVAIPSNRDAVILSSKSLDDVEVKYSPDQERDEHGRFGTGGGHIADMQGHVDAMAAHHEDMRREMPRAPKDAGRVLQAQQSVDAANAAHGRGDYAVAAGHLSDAAFHLTEASHADGLYQSSAIASAARDTSNAYSGAKSFDDIDLKAKADQIAVAALAADLGLKYSEDQERDEHGRFSGGGSGGSGGGMNLSEANGAGNAMSQLAENMGKLAGETPAYTEASVHSSINAAKSSAFNAHSNHFIGRFDSASNSHDNAALHLQSAANLISASSPAHAEQAQSIASAARDLSNSYGYGWDSGFGTRSFDGAQVKEYTEEQFISSTDAIIDAALAMIEKIDTESLPTEVQQVFALIQAADVAVDELMELAGVDDPDDETESADGEAAEESAAAKSADEVAIEAHAIKLIAESFK